MAEESASSIDLSKRNLLVAPVHGDAATDPTAARDIHGACIVGAIYAATLGRQIASMFEDSDALRQSAVVYARDVFERLAPRDPIEEMLVSQLILSHVRVVHLTNWATRQDRPEPLRVTNEYADRASNTYRRLMLALSEYRRPPRPSGTFTAIGQANFATNQVVHNETLGSGIATNEQGSSVGLPILPAHRGGLGLAPTECVLGQAMDAIDGTTNARGQGSGEPQRAEAW